MQWLMIHMWTALAAAGVLGLLFGWSVRGLRLNGRLRRAEGERNIALGSIEEKDAELEALYASGRTQVASESSAVAVNDEQLRAELEEREIKLQTLSDELARSKAELSELRDNGAGVAGKVAAAAAVGASIAGIAAAGDTSNEPSKLDADLNENDASLEWRNRYLESRVRGLQTKVQELSDGATEPASAIVAPVPVNADSSSSTKEDVGTAKIAWQNEYLRQRLVYFEKFGPPSIRSTQDHEIPKETDAGGVETASTDNTIEGTSDQEIAKLRWRNRYLEGRLAYYEGDKDVPEDTGSGNLKALAATSAVAVVGTAGLAAAASEEDTLDDVIDEIVVDSTTEELHEFVDDDMGDVESLETEPVVSDEIESTDADLKDIDVNEADSLEGNTDKEDVPEEDTTEPDTPSSDPELGEKPIALEAPVGGEGDDLTAIGGIGPKIQEVLNELGVFHFDQIAAWSPDNVLWVDEHLAFKGRIAREQWVEQAAALSV